MANRFAVGDTLGYQVYNQYLNQEIARKRAEEERRKQEEQRSKAKKHNAFGQLVNTAGSVIGAGIGAATGGVPGALAGYQMGSAGSNLLMNLFPNIGGTEPDSSNPYYDKPSNMQVANQALGVGLQAYGQYNQYLGEQAKANLVDFTKSLITDPSRSQAMTVDEIKTAIKESKEYEDAKGIFGESVISDNTISQIAQNAYDGIGQQAIKMFDMIQKAPVNEGTQGMIDKWYNRYGTAYNNLLPEGMKENLTTSVTETIEKTTQGAIKDANARAVQLFETNYNIAQLGQKKTINPINVEGADPQLQSSLNRLVDATRDATIAGNTQTANDKLKKDAASVLQDVTTALGKTEQGSQAQQALSSLATGLAQQAYGLDPETTSVIYSNFAKDVKPPQDDLLKTAQEIAQRQFLELTKRDGEALTPQDVAKLHIQNDPTLRSPVTLEILRLASGAKDNQELIAYADSLREVNVDEAKQKRWYERWGIFNYIFGGSDPDVSSKAGGNNEVFNDFMNLD